MNDTTLEFLLKTLPFPVALIDLNNRTVVGCSPEFSAHFPNQTIIGGTVDQWLPISNGESVANVVERVRESSSQAAVRVPADGTDPNDPTNYEWELRRIPESTPPYALVTRSRSTALQDDSSSYDAIVRAILDNTSAVIYAKDGKGCYRLVNRRFEELFSLHRDEIYGSTDYGIFDQDRADAFTRNDRLVMDSNEAIEFEELAPHSDGLHTYISLKFPFRDEHGNATGICGISTDITPRKRVEAALLQSETRFRQLADNVRECFWVTEVDSWQVLYVSPAYERIWGRSCSSLYKDREAWINAIHPSDRERVGKSFLDHVKSGNYREEYRVVRPNGEIRWVSDRGVPIYDDQGHVVRIAGIAEDITQRRQLEQEVAAISTHERRRISRELHDSLGQQLTGLGYLAKSLVKRLESKLPTEAGQAELIRNGIQEAIAEVRRVVRGLAPVDFDVNALSTALRTLAEHVQERFPIDCRYVCPKDVEIENDAVAPQLYRIAQEAINNAIKHAEADHVEIRFTEQQDSILLSVTDDGRGFDTSIENSGMGLRIMRYRATMIGAGLEVLSVHDSSKDHGTTVTVKFKRE